MDAQITLTALTFIGLVIDRILTAYALKKEEFHEKNPTIVTLINKFGFYQGLLIHSLVSIPIYLIVVWFVAGYVGWWIASAPAIVFAVQVWNVSRLFKKKLSPEDLAAAKIHWYFKQNYG
jgi:uncharacterized protein YacL